MTDRCRHERNMWVIGGGTAAWCYVCGAICRLEKTGENSSRKASNWVRPTGDRDDNPWEKAKT